MDKALAEKTKRVLSSLYNNKTVQENKSNKCVKTKEHIICLLEEKKTNKTPP